MPLHFPWVESIHLARPPLREVVCQVKFPAILRIAQEEPAQFQEHIRRDFPLLSIEHGVLFEPEGERPSGRVNMPPATYYFSNQDRTSKVSLSANFYALSTVQYQGWSTFASYLSKVADAMQQTYELPVATRLGLRYINMLDVTFTETGTFEDVLEIVRDELTIMLRIDSIQEPNMAMQRIETTNNGENFAFQYGLIYDGDPLTKKFVLDFDYSTQGEISPDHILEQCNRYHQTIYQAFRWCIADGQLSVFHPQTDSSD